MKELEKIYQDKIGIHAEIPVKRELKYIGTLTPHKGHKCYEYEIETGVIREAEFEEVAVNYADAAKGVMSVRKKLIVKDGCIYATALNVKNAIKHFDKMINNLI